MGTKFRELFFNIYPGLQERVLREQAFALKHGYVRAWTGPVRHLAELRWLKKNAQGNIVGMDKKLFSKMFTHLKNDAANSTIQTAEVYQAMPDVTEIHNTLKEWGLKSKIFNYVHDSIDIYIYKPEKDIVYALLNQVAQTHRQPFYNLPQHLDVEECDLLDEDMYYKHGKEINIEKYNLQEELDKWNKANGTNLQYVSKIPIIGKIL